MNNLSQQELWELRALIQKVGWGEFMMHIGSIMAEQADKVKPDSPQDKALYNMSTFIHNAKNYWDDCGFFDYRKFGKDMIDDEYFKILEAKPPVNEVKSEGHQ